MYFSIVNIISVYLEIFIKFYSKEEFIKQLENEVLKW